jgi:hypothetical protein
MLQPIGPQLAALLVTPCEDWLPAPDILKTEKAFLA